MKRQSVSHFEGQANAQSARSVSRSHARSHRFSVRPTRQAIAATALAGLLVGVLAGCSSADPQAIDYKSTGRVKAPSLATPPDLMAEDRARDAATANGDASLSTYRASGGTPVAVEQVLPPAQGLHIERDGGQRWLVVSSIPPAQLWEQIRAFWQEQGFILAEDSRQRGVMQTDWQESRAKVDLGIIRNTLSMAVNNSYVTGERNRYRTRLEPGKDGSTYVFISQQGLHEVLTGSSNDGSEWQPKPNDPGLEAEYLGRLQRALAQGPKRSVIGEPEASPPPSRTAAAAPNNEAVVPAQTLPVGVQPAEGSAVLLSEGYERAWARVGTALDRGSFTVDDRDRDRGLYFVRYADPNDFGTATQGFWSQVFHGKREKVAKQFQINVRALTEDSTRVALLDSTGKPDTSALGQRIMRLLVSEL